MTSVHVSVMPDEVLEALAPLKPKTIVDGTFGGGGHSERLLQVLADDPESKIIGLDRDPDVIERVQTEKIDPRIEVFLVSYEFTERALAQFGLEQIDGMVLDLGLSSDQLESDRGFSFQNDGPLDLRFDPEVGQPVFQWLAKADAKKIADVIYKYGEERFSRRIAREIVARRQRGESVQTVFELTEICRRCVPRSKNHDIHPATRTFQALRIFINDELGGLERTLKKAPQWIRPGGRLAIISFHSLEDRIVKQAFRDDDRWNVLTKKPLLPSDAEIKANPRSRSAKFRIAERSVS